MVGYGVAAGGDAVEVVVVDDDQVRGGTCLEGCGSN